jgi:hypothetical protein
MVRIDLAAPARPMRINENFSTWLSFATPAALAGCSYLAGVIGLCFVTNLASICLNTLLLISQSQRVTHWFKIGILNP